MTAASTRKAAATKATKAVQKPATWLEAVSAAASNAGVILNGMLQAPGGDWDDTRFVIEVAHDELKYLDSLTGGDIDSGEVTMCCYKSVAILRAALALDEAPAHFRVVVESVIQQIDAVSEEPIRSPGKAPASDEGTTAPEIGRAEPVVTDDTPLTEGGEVTMRILQDCAWETESITQLLLDLPLDTDDEYLVRMVCKRVRQLNALVRTYVTDDAAVSIADAKKVISDVAYVEHAQIGGAA